jgi:hypothetical protein
VSAELVYTTQHSDERVAVTHAGGQVHAARASFENVTDAKQNTTGLTRLDRGEAWEVIEGEERDADIASAFGSREFTQQQLTRDCVARQARDRIGLRSSQACFVRTLTGRTQHHQADHSHHSSGDWYNQPSLEPERWIEYVPDAYTREQCDNAAQRGIRRGMTISCAHMSAFIDRLSCQPPNRCVTILS